MKVYSLTGKSGTGKSYQAQNLCAERGIQAMIDDGLFIYKDAVAAGTSAKRQKTKAGAIRTALFRDDAVAEETRAKIRELAPESILVLGTSDRMADMIAERLGLPPITERIHIEEITTEEERTAASQQRREQGKHVIPVPTVQLKRDFAGYFMDPMSLWRKAVAQAEKTSDAISREGLGSTLLQSLIPEPSGQVAGTVVRPTYSYMGDFLISDRVITDIAECVMKEVDGVTGVLGVIETTSPESMELYAIITVRKAPGAMAAAERFQKRLAEAVEEMTAFNVVRTDVEVRGLTEIPAETR